MKMLIMMVRMVEMNRDVRVLFRAAPPNSTCVM